MSCQGFLLGAEHQGKGLEETFWGRWALQGVEVGPEGFVVILNVNFWRSHITCK